MWLQVCIREHHVFYLYSIHSCILKVTLFCVLSIKNKYVLHQYIFIIHLVTFSTYILFRIIGISFIWIVFVLCWTNNISCKHVYCFSLAYAIITLLQYSVCNKESQVNTCKCTCYYYYYFKKSIRFFLAFDFCRFCVVIRFFHPRHNGQ